MNRNLWTTAVVAMVLPAMLAGSAAAQIRVVEWNTMTNSGSLNSGIPAVLSAIGSESVNGVARPADVFALQELSYGDGSTDLIVQELNNLYGAGTYARGNQSPYYQYGMYVNVVYNTTTVALEETVYAQAGSAPRATGRYRFGVVGYDDGADFYVYNSHYKAGTSTSDQTKRRSEAFLIRYDASFGSDNLPADANIIYAGDYNQRTSFEDADNSYGSIFENPYYILTQGAAPWGGTSGDGQAVDPIGRPGFWHDGLSFRDIHTQAPSTSFGSGGGMDDRFDFQMISEELNDGEGLSYIGPGVGDMPPSLDHSYRAFGNDGSHTMNSNISTGTGASPSVLAALEVASDHLPVVADYQLPAIQGVAVSAVPTQFIVGATVEVDVTVSNQAAPSVAVGADELDYAVSGTGGVGGGGGGTIAVFGADQVRTVTLDSSTAGLVFGTIEVDASSQNASNGSFSQNVVAAALDHSEASFAAGTDSNTLVLALGDVAPGTGTHETPFSIHNLLAVSGWTAQLELDGSSGSGDASVLTASGITGLIGPGGSTSFDAVLDADAGTDGVLAATWTIDVSDEDQLGASAGTSLTLELSGYVAIGGDATVDRMVSIGDLGVLAGSYGMSGKTWTEGDFTGDGDVGIGDLGVLAGNYGTDLTSIPEPASLAGLVLGALALLRRRC